MRGHAFRMLGFVSLLFCSCEKGVVEKSEETGVGPPPARGAAFAKEYEDWKSRAVREFPDLGKAGTQLNSLFVARAKQLAERNADELKYPNWPYLLAVKIKAEQAASDKPEPVKNIAVGVLDAIGKVYTVQDLRGMNSLSGAAVVLGRVTKFDESGMPPGVLSVVLDDALRCEVTMYEIGPGDNFVWQRSGSSISLARQMDRGRTAPVASVSMGQLLRVEGAFAQRRGKPVLVGSIKYN
jgi:hypothetical protein